jgi:Ala-tRNA(Pro) deacylase
MFLPVFGRLQSRLVRQAGRRCRMALLTLTGYLDENNIEYVVITHSPAFTAQCIAGLAHIPGKELAKTVMVELDSQLAMAVLPANLRVDLLQLKKAANVRTAALASEDEFYGRFPMCETGAMPPFGNLFGIAVYAEESLARDIEIAFNAGTHRELIRMAWRDYERLVKPKIICFAAGHHVEAA